MTQTNFAKTRSIPKKVTTKKSSPITTNFAKGIFTYKPNDTMNYDEIYLAQNARFERIGEYKTRRGLSKLTEINVEVQTSGNFVDSGYEMVSAVDRSFSMPDTVPTNSLVFKIKTKLQISKAPRVVTCIAYNNSNNKEINRSSAKLNSTSVTTVEFDFKDGVQPTSNTRFKFAFQDGTQDGLKVANVSGGYTMWEAKWSTHFGYVTNVFEANISGTKTILFTHKDPTANTVKLYRAAANGTVTLIRTLPSTVTKVRFLQSGNKVRYVDGKEGPRLLDPSNSWADSAISTIDLKTGVDLNIKTSNILAGTQDNIIYFDADTTTQAVWTYPYGFEYAPEASFLTSAALNEYVPGSTTTTTIQKSTLTPTSSTYPVSSLATGDLILDDNGNYGSVSSISGNNITVTAISHTAEPVNSYDKFDRDFRQNFPAIDTGDPLTAMFNLGGIVYFLTRRNKYYMYSQTADVWTQQASSAQHGTFSQESCVCDLNYAYYASDDGIYVFDGTSEVSITQNTIQSTYDAISNKEGITLELYNNRLYVFYSKSGGRNNSCLVYNINLRLWESFDTGTVVSATAARQTASNRFICGSARFCQLFLFEDNSNDYSDLGSNIDFDLETSYLHFGTPSQLHRIVKWRPEFSKVDDDYAIKCGYALDFTNDVKYAYSINLKNNIVLNEHYVWDNPSNYGNLVTPTKLTTIPQVNGQFYRAQIRYQLHAAFCPVNFKAHTLSVETQRLR